MSGVQSLFLPVHIQPDILMQLPSPMRSSYLRDPSTSTNPLYRDVCSSGKVGYAELIEFFYRSHDPTTVDRQGGDVGTQYRSAIFTTTPEQPAAIARRVTEEVQAKHFMLKWEAEEYHQPYLDKNPDGYQCPTYRLHW
ncbi:peptide methionine sulfoxide reductase [Mycena rebaudengoi]|nr:peptide methionine sulfoxide reductase [Mycena rebaudengoi]